MSIDFNVHHPKVKSLTLTQPSHLAVDHRYRPEEFPLESRSKQPYNLLLIDTLGRQNTACV